MQNYRAQAEEITLLAFWDLDKQIQENIFIHKKRVLRFLQKYKEAIQQKTKKVPKQHLKLLLEKAFDYLPAHIQCELLCLELYDLLETYRQKLTKKRIFTVDEAFDLYSDYLSFTYRLHKYPSKWFDILIQESQTDWLDVAETVKFITTTRLRASALHFRKDLQLIADNSEKIAAKIVYSVDFLGIEVHIKKTNYSLDRLYAFDEFPIPAVAGKFAETLRSYIFEALNDTQYQLAIQEMQEGLLAHDFGIALAHYKESKPLFNKVDFSFSLKGGAGSVSMNIKTWASLGKRVLAPIRKLFTVKRDVSKTSPAIGIAVGIFFVLLGGGIVWWAKFADELKYIVPLVIVGAIPVLILFLLVVLILNARQFKVVRIDGEEFLVNRSEIGYKPKNIQINRFSVYQYALADKKQALEKLKNSTDVYERTYSEVWAELRKTVGRKVEQYRNGSLFFWFLELYQKAFDYIIQQPETDEACLPVIRYILLKRLKKSIEHFDALDKFANEHRITPKLYIVLFDAETRLDIDMSAHYPNSTIHELYQKIDKQAIYPLVGKEDKALHAFMVGKLQALQDDIFLEDLAELNREYTKDQPFLLEGEEIVASDGKQG
ncbi:MAG: hypothetical protein EAZ95_07980 [Bacteroidetes bacterium]|nr:MAG: hypothetical protein EAZ95_07980 [Bacteroidota bacterium]